MTYRVRGAGQIKCVDNDKNGLMHLLIVLIAVSAERM